MQYFFFMFHSVIVFVMIIHQRKKCVLSYFMSCSNLSIKRYFILFDNPELNQGCVLNL